MEFAWNCRDEDGEDIVTVGLADGKYVALCAECLVTAAVDDWMVVTDGIIAVRFVPLTSDDIAPDVIRRINAGVKI